MTTLIGQLHRRASGLDPGAIAAVTRLGAWPGAMIADLAAVAGVTHSVMVRTVERLRTDGLLARQAVEDGRKVALTLTDAGERLRTEILAARARALEPALDALPAQDRQAVAAALDAMLAATVILVRFPASVPARRPGSKSRRSAPWNSGWGTAAGEKFVVWSGGRVGLLMHPGGHAGFARCIPPPDAFAHQSQAAASYFCQTDGPGLAEIGFLAG